MFQDRKTPVAEQNFTTVAAPEPAPSRASPATPQAATPRRRGRSIAIGKANQGFAAQDYQRFNDLVHTGYGTVQRVQQAQATLRAADAAVTRDGATLASATKQSDVLTAQLDKAEAGLSRDQALARQ